MVALPSRITGDRSDDGTDLLVAGEGEEGGRASVGLHADLLDALVRVGELVDAVGVDGAAGVLVEADQRREFGRGLEAAGNAAAEGGTGDPPAQGPGGVGAGAVLGLSEVGEGRRDGERGGSGFPRAAVPDRMRLRAPELLAAADRGGRRAVTRCRWH